MGDFIALSIALVAIVGGLIYLEQINPPGDVEQLSEGWLAAGLVLRITAIVVVMIIICIDMSIAGLWLMT